MVKTQLAARRTKTGRANRRTRREPAPSFTAQSLSEALRSLVDWPWYLAAYPDVRTAGVDPVCHYLEQGWRDGRQPNFYFDPYWFISEHPEISRDADPLIVYLTQGELQGWPPSQHFDLNWYRCTYEPPPGQSILGHFLRHRRSGTVSPNPGFDAAFYLNQYKDVAQAGLDPFEHFCLHGRAEGRMPKSEVDIIRASGLVDLNYYLLNNTDVHEASADPVEHFCHKGWKEGRKPSLYFDTVWYLERYKPLSPANPLLHYILCGEAQGCLPSKYFNPLWYRKRYAGEQLESPLQHYMRHRRTQKFSPLPFFDVDFYMSAYADSIRPNRDPFMHYLAVGGKRNFNPSPWFNAASYRNTQMPLHPDGTSQTAMEQDNPLLHFLTQLVF
ncbi:hypothetical protein SAMN02746095_01009 [Acidocella aminolytica 101 = DSM 11237]|uniref:hypothetical protein n=1 Tax=Acidocella aminolytica TaxID=33998 RepID=UPI000662BC29|nr:hypothetical protein [Acidocella aminolytica]SHE67614.1 hypothetical protein SAMN02746095_01009 [Acidocella aminolytica 101 = DSM 11237]